MASDSRLLNDPYERILALGERELELVQAERWEELAALGSEREELIASLPAVAPQIARGSLERAAELQQRVSLELARSPLPARASGVSTAAAARRPATHRRSSGASWSTAPARASFRLKRGPLLPTTPTGSQGLGSGLDPWMDDRKVHP
jgi:hypothetical protein